MCELKLKSPVPCPHLSSAVQVAAVDPAPPSLPAGITPDEKVPASVPERAPEEKTEAGPLPQSPPSLPQEADEAKKKPAGAVSLFGGIDVLGEKPEFLKVRRGIHRFPFHLYTNPLVSVICPLLKGSLLLMSFYFSDLTITYSSQSLAYTCEYTVL